MLMLLLCFFFVSIKRERAAENLCLLLFCIRTDEPFTDRNERKTKKRIVAQTAAEAATRSLVRPPFNTILYTVLPAYTAHHLCKC